MQKDINTIDQDLANSEMLLNKNKESLVDSQIKAAELENLLKTKKELESAARNELSTAKKDDILLQIADAQSIDERNKIISKIVDNLDSPDINKAIKNQADLDRLVKNNVVSEKELKDLYNKSQMFGVRQLDEGSMSNRGVVTKFINPLLYTGSRAVGKAAQTAGVVKSAVLKPPQELIARTGNTPYARILTDAINKGTDSYNATILTLMQSDANFRQLMKEEDEN